MYDFLPLKIRAPLYNSGAEKLCEIRLRAGRPVMLRTDKRYLYLSPEGVTHSAADALKISVSEIAETVLMLCERSVYAYADKNFYFSPFASLSLFTQHNFHRQYRLLQP